MDTSHAGARHGTIPRMVQDSAGRWPEAVAVVDGASLSYAELAEQARAVTGGLLAAGIEPGDRVALWAPNGAPWIVAALGIQGTGAWLVPLNTRFKGSEAAHILGRTRAAALLVADGFLPAVSAEAVRAVDPDLPALRQVIAIPASGAATTADWEALLAAGRANLEAADRRIAAGDGEDTSDVIFTSGTTGEPKGVLLRHAASLRAYEAFNTAYGSGPGDRHLITTPFFHCFGYKAGWMLALLTGATTVPLATFDADRALALIAQHRITHVPGAPTVFSSLLRHPARADHDLSSLRVAIVAAATISPKLIEDLDRELGLETIMSGYGLTENHAIGTFTRPGDPLEAVSGSVGAPAPGVEVRIVGVDGRDLPTGEDGEVLLGGFAHMTGYYEDPRATAEVLRDGWLATGDVGHLDGHGRLHLTDRKKDIFIVGGFNVAPAEVESALARIPGVAQVSVVGVPDDRLGEVAMAFVVPEAGSDLTAERVVEHARATMANYKVPRRVRLVGELPVNATGKVLRHVLRDLGAAEVAS